MNLWKFDYEFDKERLLLEAKNPIGYGPGEGINTERTYYSRGNGEAEVVDKADIQDYLEKEPFHIKLAREKLNMYVKTKEADSSYHQRSPSMPVRQLPLLFFCVPYSGLSVFFVRSS